MVMGILGGFMKAMVGALVMVVMIMMCLITTAAQEMGVKPAMVIQVMRDETTLGGKDRWARIHFTSGGVTTYLAIFYTPSKISQKSFAIMHGQDGKWSIIAYRSRHYFDMAGRHFYISENCLPKNNDIGVVQIYRSEGQLQAQLLPLNDQRLKYLFNLADYLVTKLQRDKHYSASSVSYSQKQYQKQAVFPNYRLSWLLSQFGEF